MAQDIAKFGKEITTFSRKIQPSELALIVLEKNDIDTLEHTKIDPYQKDTNHAHLR